MINPLDYAKRESFAQATELGIEEVKVVSATLFECLVKKFFKDARLAPDDEVDIGSVTKVISDAYKAEAEGGENKAMDLESEDSAPIIQLANRIIEDAYVSGASDIHVEPMERTSLSGTASTACARKSCGCRNRSPPRLVTRLKIMCNLDISERRLPQDGRIVFKKYTKKNIDIDLRVATGPTNFGEKVVMRILDKKKSTLPLPGSASPRKTWPNTATASASPTA